MKLAAVNDLQFLAGGGEMGELTRSKDWSSTALGDPETWPQSLRTTLSIVLNSSFPMVLFWGNDLTCFYNDAFRPSLGKEGKHPYMLGMKGEDAWAEIWSTIKPWIDSVLNENRSIWNEDLLVPIYRNGKIEDVYWTFSYSPVHDESGKPAGVFVAVVETTDKVNTLKNLQETEQRFRNTVKQAPVGITILRGKDFIVEMANEPYLELVGRKEETFVGRPLFDSLPEVEDIVHPLLDTVLNTGMPYRGNEVPIPVKRLGKEQGSYFNFLYYPLKEEDGSISGIIVTVTEVVEQVMARKKIEESEARFRSLIEQSPMAMVVLKGADHIVEIANSAMLKRWNKTMEEIANKKFIDVFPEIRDQKFPALIDEVYYTGKEYHESEAPSQVPGKDGRQCYVDFEYSPLFEADGSVSGVIATVVDVTEKVEARMKIEESEKKFRLLADAMPQHIWTSDPEGNLNYFNQSVFDYSGLTPEQINKDGWIQIVHPDDRDENIKQWSNAIATETDFLFEHRFCRHDGVYRWMLSRAIPHKDEHGEIQVWVGTSTDIQDIKELDQQKDSFLSMASHELKTPVTTIKAYGQIAEAMLEKKGDTETLAMISKMGIQVNKLTNLIGDLLDITRIQKGKLRYKEDFFNLNEVVKDVVDDMQRTSTTHRIQNNAGEDIKIYGDKEKIGQVLNNLISNAIKYSPGADKIIVSTQPKDNGVEVSVQDFGIGIPAKEQQHVFEQFYRVTGNNQSTFPGMGIGLYICSEITKMHGGKIWADSVMGEGSTFHIWLPKDHREGK